MRNQTKQSKRLGRDGGKRQSPNDGGNALNTQSPTARIDSGKGLVLDDFLVGVREVRKEFGLSSETLPDDRLKLHAYAARALEALVAKIIKFQQPGIFVKAGYPLLAEFDRDIERKRISTPVYSGFQLDPSSAHNILSIVIDAALRTIVDLPERDQVPHGAQRRKLKSLGLRATKVAVDLESAVKNPALFRYFRPAAATILETARDLQAIGRGLRAEPRKIVRRDGPSPQLNFALWFVGWIEAATGSQQYTAVQDLIDAAFQANRQDTPNWASRLAIEMHGKRVMRQKWAASITVKAPPEALGH